MVCGDCGSSELRQHTEIYQDCVKPMGMPERCIAIVIPVVECDNCGSKWLTTEARELIDRAHFEAL